MIVGICWLFMFPFHGYWRKTYFSENALLVNQATTSFGRHHEGHTIQEMRQALARAWQHDPTLALRAALDEVESALRGLGLTTEVQTFKYKKTPGGELYEGRNVHGIVHAPRSDHVEAIVVCTSLRTARGEPNDNGVALLTAFAEFAIRQNYWAKDVIILVTDSGEAGVEHWLKSYHGEQAEGTTTLKKRSGIIQAALGIELPPVVQEGSQEGGYESLGTYYLSNTGQLPNLDYVNVVTAVSKFRGIPSVANGHYIDNDQQRGLWGKYRQAVDWLAGTVKAQVAGSDVCLHIPFLKYKIDALTIGARPQPDLRGDDFNTDIIVIGRIVDSVTRSLNNLLEHLHQSFFFYILPAPNKYIPIGDYMPVVGVMAASLLLQAMGLWVSVCKSDRGLAGGPEYRDQQGFAVSSQKKLWAQVPQAVRVVTMFHALGALIYLAYVWVGIPANDLFYLFACSIGWTLLIGFTAVGHAKQRRRRHQKQQLQREEKHGGATDWWVLKVVVGVYTSVAISVVSMTNLSVALCLALLGGVPLLLTRPFGNLDRAAFPYAEKLDRMCAGGLRWAPVMLATLFNPLVVLTTLGIFGPGMQGGWEYLLSEHYLFGATTFLVICLIYWPINSLTILLNVI